jgi:hypothetical protein
MANLLTTQILEDGDRNVVVHVVGFLDTSDLAATTILDPATLTARFPPFSQLRIDKIEFAVEDTLTVNVLWDATADVTAATLVGRGCLKWKDTGGLINNAGAGKTGAIQVATQGWAAAAVLAFTFTMYCVKQ